MRKRIRLHQVQIGMYIDEIEHSDNYTDSRRSGPFLIATQGDLDQICNSNVLSLVIDCSKGADVQRSIHSPPYTCMGFHRELRICFSHRDLRDAADCISKTMPHIRKALINRCSSLDARIISAETAVDQIMDTSKHSVLAMISLARLKQRDDATFLHSLSVSLLMISLGRYLNLNEDTVKLLGVGGLVHDLGKIETPDHILTKEGPLTVEEFEVVKLHPNAGYNMLRQLPDIPPAVLDICLYHHEKMDGSGYPSGHTGANIPYSARIAAICDVYDALTTIRPYKQAWTQARAIDFMQRSTGHFDPSILTQFMRAISGESWTDRESINPLSNYTSE